MYNALRVKIIERQIVAGLKTATNKSIAASGAGRMSNLLQITISNNLG